MVEKESKLILTLLFLFLYFASYIVLSLNGAYYLPLKGSHKFFVYSPIGLEDHLDDSMAAVKAGLTHCRSPSFYNKTAMPLLNILYYPLLVLDRSSVHKKISSGW